ncbi:MAG: AtpZ/AtpI family protein [Planctomycetota bacterium]
MADPDPHSKPDPDDPPRHPPGWGDRFFGLSPRQRNDAADEDRRQKHAMAGAGFELAAGIGLFAGLGYLIDRWLNLLPWCTVTGAMLGMIAGMYLLIKAAQKQNGG